MASNPNIVSNCPTIRVYRSLRDELLLVLAFIAASVLAYYLTKFFPISAHQFNLPIIGVINFPFFSIIPILVLVALAHAMFDQKYIIGPDYVRCIEGIWSFREKDVRLNYDKIRAVEIDHTLLQKILGVGDVLITGAGQSDVKICFHGICRPAKIRAILEERMQHQVDLDEAEEE